MNAQLTQDVPQWPPVISIQRPAPLYYAKAVLYNLKPTLLRRALVRLRVVGRRDSHRPKVFGWLQEQEIVSTKLETERLVFALHLLDQKPRRRHCRVFWPALVYAHYTEELRRYVRPNATRLL